MAKRHTGCPWLILDLVAMRRGDTIYVSCKVLNPAPGELAIEVSGDFNSVEEAVGLPTPNCGTPCPEMFTFTMKGPAFVSAYLFDDNGNLQYQTTPVPVGEARSKEKTTTAAAAKPKK